MQLRTALFVISGASGSGKTSLCAAVLQRVPRLQLSVSCTTRRPRSGEQPGVDYHFVDDPRFDRMVLAGEFVEWAWVHGNRYGTSHQELDRIAAAGDDVLLDVDVQGGANIRRYYADRAVLIFVLPPNIDALRARLQKRGTDTPEAIDRRLQAARKENALGARYEYIVVNDRIDDATDEVVAVIRAARCRSATRLPSLPGNLFEPLDSS
jgi:guanylate kinase